MNTFINTARTVISRPVNVRWAALLSGAWFLTGWGASASTNADAATTQTGALLADASTSIGGILDFVEGLFQSTQAMFTQFYFADHAALALAAVTWLIGALVTVRVARVIVKAARVIVIGFARMRGFSYPVEILPNGKSV